MYPCVFVCARVRALACVYQCAEFEQWTEATLIVHNVMRRNVTYSLDLGATAGRPCLMVGGDGGVDGECTIDCATLAREVGTYVVQVNSLLGTGSRFQRLTVTGAARVQVALSEQVCFCALSEHAIATLLLSAAVRV